MRQTSAIQLVLDALPSRTCVVWPGRMGRDGYGLGRIDRRTMVAHRLIFRLTRGAIPDGLQLDHLCRNRACCNPAHLEPVTAKENLARARQAPTGVDPRTHCINGHRMTQENTYVRPNGHRDCRACIRLRVASYKSRRSA